MKEIYKIVEENLKCSLKLLKKYDEDIAGLIVENEKKVDLMVKEASLNHIERLKKKICSVAASTIYTDILNNLERISDHCMNIMKNVQKFSE
jgi:phosphate:Na+ symporter